MQDHRAGAEAGVRLARRCCDHAPDAATADELGRLADDIEADRVSLVAIMGGLNVNPSAIKNVTSVAAERLGRLKLNGRLVRRSPLSTVLELEALIGAVSVKQELWATLAALAAEPETTDLRLATLLARADDQRTRLQHMHERVVRQLFGAASTTSTPPGSTTGGRDAG